MDADPRRVKTDEPIAVRVPSRNLPRHGWATRAGGRVLWVAIALGSIDCGRVSTGSTVATLDAAAQGDGDEALVEVARIHGGAGPWAVAGYRMGRYALGALGLHRGTFDLEVVHFTPHEVQYSCIADGAGAATGASLGKLNLTLADAVAADTRTVYRRRSTGQSVTLRVTKTFAARFADVARERLADAGREVLAMRDGEIFETAP